MGSISMSRDSSPVLGTPLSKSLGTSLGTDVVSFALDGLVDLDDEKPLYIDAINSSQSLNARQLRVLVRKLVAGLKAFGVQNGDRVVVHLFNSVIYPALYFGIIGAGSIYVGSNPAYRLFELDHLFRLVEPTVVVTCESLLSGVLEAKTASAIPSARVYCIDAAAFDITKYAERASSPPDSHIVHSSCDGKAAHYSFEDLLMHGESDWLRIRDQETAKATPAALFTTSGKAAVHSHFSLISQQLCIHQKVTYQVVRLIRMPFFHLYGTLFAHTLPIRYGEPIYIFQRFILAEFVSAIQTYQITDTFLSPQMLFAINAYTPTPPLKTLLQTLQYVICGGEKMTAPPQLEFCGHVSSKAVVTQALGLTEVGAVTLMSWPEQDTSGSVGRCLPGCEIKLVDDQGNIIHSDSQPGEAYVRTPNVMQGYWKESSGQSSILNENDWLYNEDVLSVEDGKHYVRGRSRELIKVAPAEIETVVRQHDQIDDVAVAGVLREDGLTEVPRAYVIRKKAAQELTANDIYAFARDRLASYKALDGGVVFVDSIPRTAVGKIQRFKLKDLVFENEPSMAPPPINGTHERNGNYVDK